METLKCGCGGDMIYSKQDTAWIFDCQNCCASIHIYFDTMENSDSEEEAILGFCLAARADVKQRLSKMLEAVLINNHNKIDDNMVLRKDIYERLLDIAKE
ncbi:MAG: hypothetical protein WC389_10965 [Lutibacter sp.]|jgi:hypothetical protein